MLTIDTREPKARIDAVRVQLPEAVVERLETGDWRLTNDQGHEEGWEVKTVGSLQSAVIQAHSDGRSILEAELADLAAAYEFRRLVVIGATWLDPTGRLLHDKMSEAQKASAGWRYATFLRILDSAADHGTPVVQLPSEYAFVEWAIARHEAFTKAHRPRAIKPKAVFAYRQEEVYPLRVLAAFPGIGPALARQWWREAGTVRLAVAHGLDGVRGIKVAEVLDMPYIAAASRSLEPEKPNPSHVTTQAEFEQANKELFG